MTTLIGRRCTHRKVLSRPVLIGRGLETFMPVLAMKRSRGPDASPEALTRFPVALAAESHPFPYRTRKLSPPAPMVLGGRPPGRVGRRRILSKRRGPSGPLLAYG